MKTFFAAIATAAMLPTLALTITSMVSYSRHRIKLSGMTAHRCTLADMTNKREANGVINGDRVHLECDISTRDEMALHGVS